MKSTTVSALFWGAALGAINIDLNNTSSIKDAASSVAKGLMSYYTGDQPGKTPGLLPGPPPQGDYYWGESAQMWNALLAYRHTTGDSSYDDVITKALLWQVGPSANYMPPNQTATLGNDDQGMWAMAAMTAAEIGLPDGPDVKWLTLVQNVFDGMTTPERWNDTDSCGGGLRWQVPLSNNGYNYKNSISTGVLFNIASRLARLTGNATYADWADKTYSWMEKVGFMETINNNATAIYDGAHVEKDCADVNRAQFSYNVGVFMEGAAHMYNSSKGADTWTERLDKLVTGAGVFAPEPACVPFEVACEEHGTCTTDMLAMKSLLLRGFAATAQYAPAVGVAAVDCVIKASAQAVGETCSDGNEGAQCGFKWLEGTDDKTRGAGQQMNALAALTAEYQVLAGVPAGAGAAAGSGSGNGTSGSPSATNGSLVATKTPSGSGAAMVTDRAGAGLLVTCALAAIGFTALLM